MKKTLLVILVILFNLSNITSQVDAKLGLFASTPFGIYLAGEYGIEDDIGLEVGIVSNPGATLAGDYYSGTAVMINARVYFSPNYGLDRFYAGLYMRPHTSVVTDRTSSFSFSPSGLPSGVGTVTEEQFRDSGISFGFLAGKKFVKDNKFVDFNLGLGRNFGRRVYTQEQPSTGFFSRRSGRIKLDFLYSISFGIRI